MRVIPCQRCLCRTCEHRVLGVCLGFVAASCCDGCLAMSKYCPIVHCPDYISTVIIGEGEL